MKLLRKPNNLLYNRSKKDNSKSARQSIVPTDLSHGGAFRGFAFFLFAIFLRVPCS
jgi:hypothetical protein